MLPFTVTLRTGLPIHDQVVHAVTRAIVSGELRAGDLFPSVRTLSKALRINPNTAHRIVATLIDRDLLAARPGIGTVVAASSSNGADVDRDRLADDIERIVVQTRRAGMSLQDLLSEVRIQWAATMKRTG
jgi:GntR family transcriptional regulator